MNKIETYSIKPNLKLRDGATENNIQCNQQEGNETYKKCTNSLGLLNLFLYDLTLTPSKSSNLFVQHKIADVMHK